MNGNKQQTLQLLWSTSTVPWSSGDKLKALSVCGEMFCSSVPCANTDDIFYKSCHFRDRELLKDLVSKCAPAVEGRQLL